MATDEAAPAVVRAHARDYFTGKAQRIRGIVAESIRRGRLRPDLRPDTDEDTLAALVTAYLLGIERMAATTTDPSAPADQIEGAGEALLAPFAVEGDVA